MEYVLWEELGVVGVQREKRRQAGDGVLGIRVWILILLAATELTG